MAIRVFDRSSTAEALLYVPLPFFNVAETVIFEPETVGITSSSKSMEVFPYDEYTPACMWMGVTDLTVIPDGIVIVTVTV